MAEGRVAKAFIVPGLPHLIFSRSEPWRNLARAFETAGERARASKPDALVIYSTQWVSVLGHSFQTQANPKGVHVDENWYEVGEIPFDFKVDRELGARAAASAASRGLATKTVDYEGFPIDTGTLVALHFFDPRKAIPVAIVSCNIYADGKASFTLGEAVAEAIRESGRRAVVVASTGLSARFFTSEIEPPGDRVQLPEDDEWNRKVLDLIRQGNNEEVLKLSPQFAAEAVADMQFKAFHWLMGAAGALNARGEVLGYGPLWGTGAAVVEYDLG